MVNGPRALRVVFFGTPEFAVPTLDGLIASRHHVVGVITQPDRPRGRGQQVVASPVKQVAERHAIPVLQPERLKDETFLDAYLAWQPDLGVVAAYGKILPAAVLAAPPLGLINVHASLLPRHRGAAPVHRAVIAGDSTTGVSIMGVVQALDAGPVFATVERAIGPDDTSVDVERDLAALGAALLVRVTDAIAGGTAHAVPQDDAAATSAHRLEKHESPIDWSLPSSVLHNRVRGLQPWPMASTVFAGRRLIIVRSRLAPGAAVSSASPGTVLEVLKDAIRVRTGDGGLDIVLLQPEGKRPMPARDFVAGHRLAAGAVFERPAETTG
jgi:methionyl-tRNA formyltransferase